MAAVTHGFSDPRVKVDAQDRPWFRFADGYWENGSSSSLAADSDGLASHFSLETEKVPVLAGINMLEQHSMSFRKNDFAICYEEGQQRSVTLRRVPSGQRVFNFLSLGLHTVSCSLTRWLATKEAHEGHKMV